jgi:hypothetical protein
MRCRYDKRAGTSCSVDHLRLSPRLGQHNSNRVLPIRLKLQLVNGLAVLHDECTSDLDLESHLSWGQAFLNVLQSESKDAKCRPTAASKFSSFLLKASVRRLSLFI